jgi:hypothetical protein
MEPGNFDTSGPTSVMDRAAEAGHPGFRGDVPMPEGTDSFLFPMTLTDPGWAEAMTEVESSLLEPSGWHNSNISMVERAAT